MEIRPATAKDVPAVAHLALAALADEAPWHAFVPKPTPELADLAEAVLARYLDRADAGLVVLEVPEGGVVAAAAWDTSDAGAAYAELPQEPQQQDQSQQQQQQQQQQHPSLAALARALAAGRQRFEGPCLHLDLLVTHPDHQRHGYGKALTVKALEAAREQHTAVCVQSASRGYILFSGLHFCDKGPTMLPSAAGDERMLKALMLDKDRVQRRGSWLDALLRYILE